MTESRAAWLREVRARKFSPHPFVKKFHCGECLRYIERVRMLRRYYKVKRPGPPVLRRSA